jgi:hypothetical protein
MGFYITHQSVPVVVSALNDRFAPGDAIEEMAALQKEFDIFNRHRSLARACALLNIVPPDSKDRRGWFKYLDHLKRTGSERDGQPVEMNGHDFVVMTLKENLESGSAMPVFFTWHPKRADPLVNIRYGQAYVFSEDKFIIVEGPIQLAPG